MKFVTPIIALVFAWFAATASAQDFSSLADDFDARNLSFDDKRFLQAALAFEGDYIGLLDGDWGKLSQRAFNAYAQREFGSAAQDWQLALLAFGLAEKYDNDGWSMSYFEALKVSLLFPDKSARAEPPSDNFVNWSVDGSSLGISLALGSLAETDKYHESVLSRHSSPIEPYVVRKSGFAVSQSVERTGTVIYVWSQEIAGLWSTVMLSASENDIGQLRAIAASLTTGRGRPITFTNNGYLQKAIEQTVALMDTMETAEHGTRRETARNEPTDGKGVGSSGSGFYVSVDGHILTNAHVIEDCTSISVNDRPASLVSKSKTFDLALLQTDFIDGGAVAQFSPKPARLNSDVTVSGYPYAGLLGGLNITRGAVSSLVGLGGDEVTMQLSAPVQAGNSGGPVIANDGEVVGVVVSKLDATKVADALGDVPQNVNFAVRGEIAKLFLSQNGVEPSLGSSDDSLEPVELAERSKRFTVFVECD